MPASSLPAPKAFGVSFSVEGIRALLAQSRLAEAFQMVNQLKARRVPIRELDYLRATCFLQQGLPFAAIESLREELRYFPDNQAAADQLSVLLGKYNLPFASGELEFQELARAVRAYTMLSEPRLLSLYTLGRQACEENLPGNFVECGVAAGGSSALLAAVILRFSRQPRRLFAFDTFEGMPMPATVDTHDGQVAEATGWGAGTCAAPESSVMEICKRLGVDHIVEVRKGLFADTLPANRQVLGPIALLHADGDWHASTMDIFNNLYDQLSPRARVQIDDYGYWSGCRQAVSEFEATRKLKFQMHVIDETGVWLVKPNT